MKVGIDIETDIKRAKLIRNIIGSDKMLAMDANSVWSIDETIKNMKRLSIFNPYWIEEPTHPDDILGYSKIAEKIKPIKVACGEQTSNKVICKQLFQSKGVSVIQSDIQRIAGLNEWIPIALMAKKFGVKMCIHSGGIGLPNMSANLCMIDYICIRGDNKGCWIEYIDHLQEHFVNKINFRDGKYFLPKTIGWGLDIKNQSLDSNKWPSGEYWKQIDLGNKWWDFQWN